MFIKHEDHKPTQLCTRGLNVLLREVSILVNITAEVLEHEQGLDEHIQVPELTYELIDTMPQS